MMDNIQVEVICTQKEEMYLIPLILPLGSRIIDALEIFSTREECKDLIFLKPITGLEGRVGIFGKVLPLETQLKNGDRVEIYQPLLQDPKERRRQKAKNHSLKKISNFNANFNVNFNANVLNDPDGKIQ